MLRILLCLLLAATVAAQTLDEVRREFRRPPKSAGPMARWWWPGGDVDADELRREIRALDEAGFAGAEIQAFRIGLNPKMPPEVAARVDDYPTLSFYRKAGEALDEARKHGLFLDLTLGSGWPFGGGEAITPELASLELRSSQVTVQGPARFRGKLAPPPPGGGFGAFLAKLTGTSIELPAGWKERLEARTRTVAVVAVKGGVPVTETRKGPLPAPVLAVTRPGELDPKSAIVLTSKLAADGALDWEAPAGTWQVFRFVQQPAEMRVIGAAGRGPQLVIDHMNRAALDAHLRRVADPAAAVIGGFRAVFCDSLEVEAELFWSSEFLKEFRKRRGYDLTPWLPFLRTPGAADPYHGYDSAPLYDGPGADRVRRDYWRTVSDLWIENFFAPLVEWAHARKLLARVQAHGAPADVQRAYGLADIPETEQLYAGGRMDFLKAAASAAHVYGRKLVSAEAFVRQGQAYQTTAQSLERDVNTLIAAGINQIVYHGFPYLYMDRPDPGWHPFTGMASFSDHFNPKTKIWADVPRINAYISRLQFIARNGRPVMRYAVYRPRLDYPNRRDGAEPAVLDYDHFHRDALEKSRARNGRLVAPSGAEYETLVLAEDDAALRRRFRGVEIVVGAPPAGEAFTKWTLGGAEFLFFFNSSGSEKSFGLPEGRYESWDAFSGETAPYTERTVRLAPGTAHLLCRLPR